MKNSPNYKHGGKGTKLYSVWQSMKQRIFNPNSKDYKYYGGRGITICLEWTDKLFLFHHNICNLYYLD